MGAKLVMSKALLSEAYEVTGMAVLAFRSWKGNNAIVLNRPQRVVSNLAVSICFIFFFERTGESGFVSRLKLLRFSDDLGCLSLTALTYALLYIISYFLS